MFVATSVRRCAAAGVAALLMLAAGPARAQDPTTMGDAMLGLAAGVCTLVYTPAKIVYAAAGVGVGALVWIFSAGNTDTMNQVLKVSAGGDYSVTPDHLRGVKVLRIAGKS